MMVPAPCKYAALSYVWGDASNQLQATKKNIESLCTESFLSSAILPQVIFDTTLACGIAALKFT